MTFEGMIVDQCSVAYNHWVVNRVLVERRSGLFHYVSNLPPNWQ
jgi:hypothetical protein